MKKMKKKIKKEYRPENKQLFNWTEMPHEFEGQESSLIIAGKYEGAGNDTYHRWYPDRIAKKEIGKYKHFETEDDWKAAKTLNKWLLKHGMKIKDEFCFHVLIHVSW